jgi:D-alanine transaminase
VARVAYVNGRYTPLADAKVDVEDRGFQFADGVYEYWSVLGGRLADAAGHLDRLERSLSELRIRQPMSRAALMRVLRETVRRNRVKEGSIYLQITTILSRIHQRAPAWWRSPARPISTPSTPKPSRGSPF